MAEVKGRPRVKTVVDKAKDKRNLQMLTLWGDRSYMHPVSQLPSPNKHLTYDKTAKEKAPSAMHPYQAKFDSNQSKTSKWLRPCLREAIPIMPLPIGGTQLPRGVAVRSLQCRAIDRGADFMVELR
uniref:Uncharacterized protein n=2 Tax=Oryza TaxID=4527 RepID=A0A0D9ZVP1_9ORYZ